MDEEGAGVTHVDAVAGMAVGQVSDLAVKLEPGRYVLVCNLSENSQHYMAGMHIVSTVNSPAASRITCAVAGRGDCLALAGVALLLFAKIYSPGLCVRASFCLRTFGACLRIGCSGRAWCCKGCVAWLRRDV